MVPKRLNYLIAPSNSTYIKKVTDCRVLDDGWLQGTVKREEAFEAKGQLITEGNFVVFKIKSLKQRTFFFLKYFCLSL